MRIVLVRHGDPDYEKDCLTELGHKQAAVAAERLLKEGNETVTHCNAFKRVATDWEKRLTDVADQEYLFHLIQSIDSNWPN